MSVRYGTVHFHTRTRQTTLPENLPIKRLLSFAYIHIKERDWVIFLEFSYKNSSLVVPVQEIEQQRSIFDWFEKDERIINIPSAKYRLKFSGTLLNPILFLERMENLS